MHCYYRPQGLNVDIFKDHYSAHCTVPFWPLYTGRATFWGTEEFLRYRQADTLKSQRVVGKALTLRKRSVVSSSRKAKMCRQSHWAGRGRAGDHSGLRTPQSEGIEQKPSRQCNQKSQTDTYLLTNIYWVLATNILWYWGMYNFFPFYS